jgi:hypothetical protein
MLQSNPAGTIIDDIEECDMGIYNVNDGGVTDPKLLEGSAYWNSACNVDCKVTNKNLWRCVWVPDLAADGTTILGYHSQCDYLRGNRVVDNLANNPDMTVPETCDPGVQQWQA